MRLGDRLLQQWRVAKVAEWVPAGGRVLDIGCADGALFKILGERIGDGIGIDPDLAVQKKWSRYRLIRGTFPASLPTRAPFDAITMLAVLEHIPEHQQKDLACACFEYLVAGGRLIVTVPSAMVDGLLRPLTRLRVVDGMSLEQHYGFDPRTTPRLFSDAGLRLIRHERFQLGLNHLFVFAKSA